MDVAKAKNVVIILLIAVNVFLLVNIFPYLNKQAELKETIRNAETILNKRGVLLECSIPMPSNSFHRFEYVNEILSRSEVARKLLGSTYQPTAEGNELQSGSKSILFTADNSFLYTDKQPNTPVDMQSNEKLGKFVRSYLEEAELLKGNYVQDQQKRNKDGSITVVFLEKFEDALLFDNYCSVTVAPEGIIEIKYQKLQAKGFLPEKVDHLQAYQSLLAHFKNGSNAVIQSIDSGYKLDDLSIKGLESVELLPVWRIKLKAGSEPLYLSSHNSENYEN